MEFTNIFRSAQPDALRKDIFSGHAHRSGHYPALTCIFFGAIEDPLPLRGLF
jgi:hypothetical protein